MTSIVAAVATLHASQLFTRLPEQNRKLADDKPLVNAGLFPLACRAAIQTRVLQAEQRYLQSMAAHSA